MRMDIWEQAAADAILARRKGTLEQRDVPGGASGQHDIDLTDPDGSVTAIEVTRAVRSDQLALWNELQRGEWRSLTLKHHWEVTVRRSVRVSELRE